MTKFCVLVLLAAVACGRPREDTGADSTSLPAVDTLKAAPTDTLAQRDSVSKTSSAKQGTATTKASQTTAAKDSTKLGRDVAVPFDPTKRRLPTVDTTKKRPPL
ncbi:MAG: hypothetical protein WD825_03060 [Gemmatimonadaceae bacterium]